MFLSSEGSFLGLVKDDWRLSDAPVFLEFVHIVTLILLRYVSSKRRRNKSRNPPGPDQAIIGWKEEEFQNLVRDMGFRPEWGAQFPTPNSTAIDAPPGYITLYAAFFREGNFRLPMTKFTSSILQNYGLHIYQINALGLPRVTHFEFICRAIRIEPTFEMFNL
ncbi:hypothetical protein Hanom_Chr10g00911591 [Helianthus anomalus]